MEALKSYYEISPFFFTITASASFLYLTMNLIMIFGGMEADDGFSHHHHNHGDLNFKFFSIQTVCAFFMGFGWGGITSTVKWKLPFVESLAIASLSGLIIMGFAAFLLYHVRKLNHVPDTLNIISAVGTKGTVYSMIPESEGEGKVQIVVSGSLKIVAAVSKEGPIDSFAEVEVIGLKDKNTLIVKKMEKMNA